MKRRYIGFLLSIGVLAVQASITPALAADLTCQVYGGTFVLDDDDFKAMRDSVVDAMDHPPGTPVTRETFASFRPAIKAKICNTRMLARLLRSGKVDYCDIAVRYKDYSPGFLNEDEAGLLNEATGWGQSGRPGLPAKKCR